MNNEKQETMMSLFPLEALRNAMMNIDSADPYIPKEFDENEAVSALNKVSEEINDTMD